MVMVANSDLMAAYALAIKYFLKHSHLPVFNVVFPLSPSVAILVAGGSSGMHETLSTECRPASSSSWR
jgi:hypothetical protein